MLARREIGYVRLDKLEELMGVIMGQLSCLKDNRAVITPPLRVTWMD